MANELYKNIIQRLPAALILVASIVGILYLQNILIILALSMVVGFLLIKEWLFLSNSKVDLKQIIFFVSLIILSIYFAEGFVDLFLAITLIFWVMYSFYLISDKQLSLISFNNNYLGIFLVLSFLCGLIHLLIFSELVSYISFIISGLVLVSLVAPSKPPAAIPIISFIS